MLSKKMRFAKKQRFLKRKSKKSKKNVVDFLAFFCDLTLIHLNKICNL